MLKDVTVRPFYQDYIACTHIHYPLFYFYENIHVIILHKVLVFLNFESCVNGATVISIDESILPGGYSDTVVVEGNRNIEREINSGLEREDANQAMPNFTIYIRPQCNSRRGCSLINRSVRGYLTRCRDHCPSAIRFTRHLHLSGAKMMKEDQ